ncbi:hypothetical protein RJ641_027646 [Dillenia turbinata]|uniref:Uncharacterized protein n=1 Tax=Dillenia turbinata TaxID=194707 RepID=A0AAN8ZIB6_9MAGN
MEKRSWVCTLIVQTSLCFTVFLALNVGRPQKLNNGGKSSRPLDIYFFSVRGGFRALKQQNHLLNLMDRVAKTYKARFVVNISELGEDDPLTLNGTRHFSSLKVPWYTTGAFKGLRADYFQKKINFLDWKSLEIIVVDTGSLQDSMLLESDDQFLWLKRTLEEPKADWRIVIGFHQLLVCEENEVQVVAKQAYEPLHHTLEKFGVDMYLSEQNCAKHARKGSVSYIGIPSPTDRYYFDFVDGASVAAKDMINGFLLHRVSSLEIVTYFITSTGEIMARATTRQKGREVV